MLGATEEQMRIRAEIELAEMKQMDCYIGFTSVRNLNALCDVPQEKMELYKNLVVQPVTMDQRLNHTKWVVLRYPSAAMAQLSNMSEEAFEQLRENVSRKVVEICRDLADGKIDIHPMKNRERSACTYCRYKGICRFDTVFEGCSYNII